MEWKDDRKRHALDALEDVEKRIQGKNLSKIHLCVLWFEDLGANNKLSWSAANLNKRDQLWLFEWAKAILVREAFGDQGETTGTQ